MYKIRQKCKNRCAKQTAGVFSPVHKTIMTLQYNYM